MVYAHYDYADGPSFQDKKNHKESRVAKEFLKLLLSTDTKISVSSMVFPEFWKAILINEIVDHEIPADTRDKTFAAEKCLAQNPLSIAKYFGNIEESTNKLAKLLESSGGRIKVRESCQEVNEKAMKVMKDCCLHSYDSIHIGSMIHDGINDFVTGDNHIISNCSRKYNIWTYPEYRQLDYILNRGTSA
ncbi:MAG: hypothetical protein PHI86_08000 [Candidatus Omnitrophica bacterium]|nr:hypothetical protein [Candidatus Omnitrophota bacterium]